MKNVHNSSLALLKKPNNAKKTTRESPRQSPQYLYWYHNSQMVNYGAGISIHTEPGIHTHSRLIIPSAGPQHTGNYTCKAANTQSATVQVYVSDGDKPAAIQRQAGSQLVAPSKGQLLILLIFLFSTCYTTLYYSSTNFLPLPPVDLNLP
ncbi:IgLON family member 5 [Orchesella cincta]|uniref:IgLON family member 5 n=1 Tax=Orchesella cincta TaxID=48709 RepID=A0A1D2NN45_ORCCI|nr:IgLON family member 5 [Orchesella cincta]